MKEILFAILTFFSPFPEEVEFNESHFKALNQAAVRVDRMKREEAYCLVGRQEGKRLIITGVIKPFQHSWREFQNINGELWTWFRIKHKKCPLHTVLHLHYHPTRNASPSPVDKVSLRRGTYKYAMILSYRKYKQDIHAILMAKDHRGKVRILDGWKPRLRTH